MEKSETAAKLEEFGKKISEDEALRARVEAIGDDMDAAVALAAEFGFTFTVDDLEALKPASDLPKGELSEDQLDNVAGGTQNRYVRGKCGTHYEFGQARTTYECVGFLGLSWCDHYQNIKQNYAIGQYWAHRHICNMGCFDYIGTNLGHVLNK